jgi:beta-galactosidase/beta-glucuronidase
MGRTAAGNAGAISSPWAAGVDRERPLGEYPRPSLVREDWLCLNGRWDYALRPIGEAPTSYDGPILVPFPIESAASGVERALAPEEALWYRRSFVLPESYRGRRIILRFGAVDWGTRVSLNGRLAGIHRGGYSPFSFDITEFLRGAPGEAQELVLEVRDPTDAGTQCRGKQVRSPRGIWYTAASGIWGSVWIEPVPKASIARVIARVVPGTRIEAGRILVDAALERPRDESASCRLRIALTEEGRVVAEKTVAVGIGLGSERVQAELVIPSPLPWSPDAPFLYGLSLELEGPDGSAGDRIESYAALRVVELGSDAEGRTRIFLNGESCFNNAVLDQGYWPEGVYTAPTDEALASDIVKAKELGFNAIRKHAKVEAERWYWHCDRLGMLVWQDIPSGGSPMRFLFSAILGYAGVRLRDDRFLGRFGRETEAGRIEFELEAAEIVDSLDFFACVVAWVPFNEGWGQFESARIARWLAERDPSRLVDAASGWYDRGVGHFSSRHDYSAKPRMPTASNGRAKGGRAAALTEYGGLTLRVAEHSTEDRRQFGYVGASDGEDLAARYEALAARLAALAREGLAASVYTQISDVEIERNGLLTYDRKLVKTDAARIRAANLALTEAGSMRGVLGH